MNAARLAVTHLPSASSAVGCCPCGCCLPNLNWPLLRTREGLIKLSEIVLGTICQNLLMSYALTYSTTLGSSYTSFLSTCSSSVVTSLLLLVTYVMSSKSFYLVRQSYFEIIYNGIISFLYISSSCYLAFAVYTYLYPVYKFMSLFQLYPEMSSTYVIGFILGAVHGYDAWLSYKRFHN